MRQSRRTSPSTQRSVDQAKAARRFQVMFNNISTPKLLKIVNKNLVKGLPITREDVKRVEEIYGQNMYALNRKTMNRKVDHVVAPITRIPKEIRNTFVVIKPDNTKMKFTILRKGLYYIDTSSLIGQPSKVGVFNQVASVEENLTKYTQRSVDQAKAA